MGSPLFDQTDTRSRKRRINKIKLEVIQTRCQIRDANTFPVLMRSSLFDQTDTRSRKGHIDKIKLKVILAATKVRDDTLSSHNRLLESRAHGLL